MSSDLIPIKEANRIHWRHRIRYSCLVQYVYGTCLVYIYKHEWAELHATFNDWRYYKKELGMCLYKTKLYSVF